MRKTLRIKRLDTARNIGRNAREGPTIKSPVITYPPHPNAFRVRLQDNAFTDHSDPTFPNPTSTSAAAALAGVGAWEGAAPPPMAGVARGGAAPPSFYDDDD